MNINFLPNNFLDLLKIESLKTEEEICGFIEIKNSEYFFHKCENLHPNKTTNFLISPKDYIRFKDCILFHSHPLESDLIEFSELDLDSQFFHCLDILLYSVKYNKFIFKKYGYS